MPATSPTPSEPTRAASPTAETPRARAVDRSDHPADATLAGFEDRRTTSHPDGDVPAPRDGGLVRVEVEHDRRVLIHPEHEVAGGNLGLQECEALLSEITEPRVVSPTFCVVVVGNDHRGYPDAQEKVQPVDPAGSSPTL